jgi:hypothetical protein
MLQVKIQNFALIWWWVAVWVGGGGGRGNTTGNVLLI